MAKNGKNGHTSRAIAYRRRRRLAKAHRTPRWLTPLAVLAGLVGIAMVVLAAVGYSVYQSYASDLIPPDQAIAKLPRGGATILDRNGKVLYQYVDDVSGISEPVTADQMSLYLVLATVATEDSSFFDNPGVNYRGLTAAAIDNLWPFGKAPGLFEGRGGSSITQQLVKNVYFTPQERSQRSISRKAKETVLALELTKKYSKQQILMWYLNLISYGNIYNGAQAAAKGYFGKDVKDLTVAEAATLAGIPASPSYYDPLNHPQAAVERRNYVLRRMYDEHYITGAQLWDAASQPLNISPQRFPVEAPHFVFNVVQPELERRFGKQALYQDGLVVHTTIDLDQEHKAQAILENWISEFESSGGHNGALVAIDPNTAEVLVYIGSRDYFSEEIQGQNDMADALNSPGSTFKPITYVTAFMKLGWGPGTLILDSPISSKYWDGKNPPRNPVAHSGPITARNALGNSLNIPAIKTILSVGVANVIEQAKKMGITTLDGRDLGPSMTVGGVDVKLSDMVYAFTAFPNLGIQRGLDSTVPGRQPGNRALDPISILRVEDRDGKILYPIVDGQPAQQPTPQEVRVAPAAESYMINSILTDPNAFCLTYGCGALSIGRPAAFKTGTSEPYEQIGLIGDTWTFGYTPQLVVGSWFGNADNSPMSGITSTSVSYRAVRDFLAQYVQDMPVVPFTRPDGLVTQSLCVPSWLLPTANCAATTPPDLLAAGSVPTKSDDWWQVAQIDTRTGKLANDRTPPRFVETRHYLNIPPDLPEFLHDEALAWAYVLGGGGSAPTEHTSASDIPATITAPAGGAQIQGVLTITGQASSPDFVSYNLQYQDSDGTWVTIWNSPTPVVDGALGVWDTTALTPGLYTLRLTVSDAQLGESTFSVPVLVFSATGPAPTGEPTQAAPPPGGGGRGHNRRGNN